MFLQENAGNFSQFKLYIKSYTGYGHILKLLSQDIYQIKNIEKRIWTKLMVRQNKMCKAVFFRKTYDSHSFTDVMVCENIRL